MCGELTIDVSILPRSRTRDREIDRNIDHQIARSRDRKIDLQIIDVREEHEFEFASIPGALLVPLNQIVNRVCEPARLVDEALETAAAIAANGPLAVRQAKKSAHYGLQMDLLTGYRFEIEAYNRLVDTEDRREGVRASNEKRKPACKVR